jgi:hypothetical protein
MTQTTASQTYDQSRETWVVNRVNNLALPLADRVHARPHDLAAPARTGPDRERDPLHPFAVTTQYSGRPGMWRHRVESLIPISTIPSDHSALLCQ